MTAIERISQRLAADHGIEIPEDTELRRLGGGQWARAQGRWSWSMWSPTSPTLAPYGSQYPATELLRCTAWEIDKPNRTSPDLSIWPCVTCQQHELGACRSQS